MANIEGSILKLEKHQQEAYDSVEKLFKEKGRASVIFPTGCGKSFVTLEYILQHPNDRILFLSPRNAIKDQMYEYIIRFIGGDTRPIEDIIQENGNLGSESIKRAAKKYIPNIECMLYQTISRYKEKNSIDDVINKLKPDLIIVDEMHHLKTKSMKEAGRSRVTSEETETIDNDILDDDFEETELSQEEQTRRNENIEEQNKWGEKFQEFLNDNPQAKLLGLTATPIRTDSANVVERMFGDAVAKEISLLEAMEEGIIYPPNYVVPDFIREDEIQTLLGRIEQAEGQKKEELKLQYDEFVKKASEAPGIPELLDEHIEERTGKYIIFCKDIADMQEKMSKSKEWFGKIDEEPEVYGISSKDDTSSEQLKAFNNSTSDKLKLMYCVGMIDEGVHLNDISGVILAAKTGSRPAYLQRLGRAISSGKDKKQALVIDLVNNNEILKKDFNIQYGYEINDLESLEKLVEWIDKENNGEIPVYSEDASIKEQTMAKRYARINNKYLKYVQNNDLLENSDEDIIEIIEIGKTIEMFETDIQIDIDDKTNTGEAIEKFLENIEIRGARKDFRELLKTNIKLTPFEEVLEFCEEKGKSPKPIYKKAVEMTEEEKREMSLYQKWLKSDEKKIVDKYTGVKIEDIPEEHRKLVEQMRGYGYEIIPFEEVLEFCEEKGRISKKIHKKAEKMTEEEKRESSVYTKWIKSDEKKIVDKYTGVKIEDIPEEHRLLVEQMRGYGYGIGKGLTPFEEVLEFCEEKGKISKQIKKKAAERTEEEKRESSVYTKWLRSEEKKIVDKYTEVKIEDIPEEHRKLVEQMRGYGYGITSFEEALEFCEEKGRIPKPIKKKAEEKTEEEKRESLVYTKWIMSEEKRIVDKYTGVKIEDIPEEHRMLVEQMRNYGYGISLTPFEKVLEFCEEKGRISKKIHKKAEERTEEEKRESSIYTKWLMSEEKKIVDKYTGVKIEDIPEEHRLLVEQMRSYGYEGKKAKSAKKLAQAVVKDVSIKETVQATEFLDLITNEKQNEGDEHSDQSGS